MRGKTLPLLLTAVVVLCGWWLWSSESGKMLTGRWTFTERAAVDRGTYFRLKVDFAYKGEPQRFDIVVGCNVLDIAYKDGSGTYEVGLVPTVYGRRMSDGKAVVVRPPKACRAPANGDYQYPDNFAPLMIVYDDADKLNFGTAYLSDDAYDSPLSLMRFGKASVHKATRAEFEEFRKNGPANIVSRAQYHSFQGKLGAEQMGLKGVWPSFARNCWAMQRFRLPEALKPYFAALRPASQPRYWVMAVSDETDALTRLASQPHQRDDGGKAESRGSYMSPEDVPNYGIPRRDGFNRPAAYYPVSSPLSSDKWPSEPTETFPILSGPGPVLIRDVYVDGGKYRGFGYCYDAPAQSMLQLNSKYLSRVPLAYSVDGQEFEIAKNSWRTSEIFVEGDEYIFKPFDMWIDSTRGDI